MKSFFIFVFLVFASRVLPHPPNMTLVLAAALWVFPFHRSGRTAWMAPIFGMALADLVLLSPWTRELALTGSGIDYTYGVSLSLGLVYLSIALITVLGQSVNPARGVLNWAGTTLGAGVLFFVVTNLGVFFFDRMYPLTLEGLMDCFVAAIPFFRPQLGSTIVFSAAFYLVHRLMAGSVATAPATSKRTSK